ncbi:hypothetical protein H8R03_33230 [Streptomyces sp. JH010]|uniref:hypothetical protein n=1 Tax=Streptomyces TaxID=1883 RepID=UPI0023F9A8F7|nr:hypothetical protein [Streptomyces sp. JH010]MDF6066764.1 hypothetical protein [Streptomyces sp. JH010]
MAARLMEEPARLVCWFTKGTTATVELPEQENPQLVRAMANGLIALMHPHGRVDAERTVQEFVRATRLFAAAMAKRGHVGGAAELTRPALVEQLWVTGAAHESMIRRMLAAFDRETQALSPEVRELVRGRAYNQRHRRDSKPLLPYDERVWSRLQEVCRAEIQEAWSQFRQARAAAERGHDPYQHGWSYENLCWWMVRHGPENAVSLGQRAGWSPTMTYYRMGRGGDAQRACTALFPSASVVIAYQLLFGAYTGIVPDGIADLGVEDLEWAGDAAMLVNYLKGRTTEESVTVSPQAVRLVERWLQHSAVSRSFTSETDASELWLRHDYTHVGVWRTGPSFHDSIQRWVIRVGLKGTDGKPLRIHRHSIRTSFESHRDRRAWFGSARGRIDPNHSPRVEGDHYLTAATPAQKDALETIVEEAQGDLLRKALPPTVLSDDDLAQLADNLPDLVSRLGLDDAAIAELVGGQRDVFVAACADPLAGLHGPKGKPCPARPWVCLLCPLSLFAPRHAANLLRMKAFFARQWQQMPAAQFMAVFGPYAHRIEQILTSYDPAELARLATMITDTDDEIPLHPEERTA